VLAFAFYIRSSVEIQESCLSGIFYFPKMNHKEKQEETPLMDFLPAFLYVNAIFF